MMPWLTF